LLAAPSLLQSQTKYFRNIADQEYIAAASQGRWNLNLDEIPCVSLSEKRDLIFGQAYTNNRSVQEVTAKLLPGKMIEHRQLECRYVLLFNLLLQTTRAVKFKGKPSTILMTFDICERSAMTEILSRACISKNGYLFNKDMEPLQAFEIGMRAFLQKQMGEWEVMRIKLQNSRGEELR
jgi:hypothetical protein